MDFTASWCGPCKMIGPYFEELAGKFPASSLSRLTSTTSRTSRKSAASPPMPTFQLYSNGVKVEELTGADKGKLEALAKQADDL